MKQYQHLEIFNQQLDGESSSYKYSMYIIYFQDCSQDSWQKHVIPFKDNQQNSKLKDDQKVQVVFQLVLIWLKSNRDL